MRDFAALRAAGCPARITIGPWRHTDEELSKAGLHDAIDWFDVHLRGAPDTTDKPVKLFVNGEDRWRTFDAWPPPEAATTAWHLQPDGGLLEQAAPQSEPDRYRYDPADPTPSVGGPALASAPFAVDNRELEARDDVLTYTSSALAQPYTVIGPVTAELYVSSTAPSADFFVRVCAVDPQGTSINICDGLQRVQLDVTGGPQRVTVELWPTAHRFAAGQRIRVQISSGAFPRWARNLGSTEPLGKARVLRPATQSIYHGPGHRSAILLPVVPA
jgi:putative CocE/NonD family hydrolase